MTTTHANYDPAHKEQLNGSSTESYDCGVLTCCMGVDHQTLGQKHPGRDAMRDRMGVQSGGTNYHDWEKGIESYTQKNGMENTDWENLKTAIKWGRPWSEVRERLLQSKPVLIGVDYKKLRQLAPSKTGSESFDGYHGILLRKAYENDDGKVKVVVYDSLNDGRYQGCPKGPVHINHDKVREAAELYSQACGYGGSNIVSYVIPWAPDAKDDVEEPPPEQPPVDPCAVEVESAYNQVLEMLETLDSPELEAFAERLRQVERQGLPDSDAEPENGLQAVGAKQG